MNANSASLFTIQRYSLYHHCICLTLVLIMSLYLLNYRAATLPTLRERNISLICELKTSKNTQIHTVTSQRRELPLSYTDPVVEVQGEI